ncbi:MAG: CPBP family intramembrane glutamic endopeptidase [Verrucomicrobiota bacterium]
MRPLRALVIYIAAVFIGGALLAPWLYRLAQIFANSFPQAAAMPFHRFLDRSFLIVALAGLWPMLRSLGATSCRDIGLVPPHGQWKKLFGGLLLGLLTLAVVAGTAIACGDRAFAPTMNAHKIVAAICGAAATAALVGTLEEILFRGGIFGGLRRVLYWPFALGISSVIYALVHFLQPVALTGPVILNSGLALLPHKLGGFADLHALVPGFFSLTLAGVLLGLAYQRTGNLYFSIGLHAGWIFCLKIYSHLTVQAPHAAIWFWGGEKMTDGWLAFFALVVTLVVLKFLPLDQRRLRYAIPK